MKRIQPAAFQPYDLTQENYTRLLWLFEGFTSYYDDLFLLRSGLISTPQYLKLLTKTMNQVLRGSGRHKQSVADSSFDTWIKYYRQEENAPNAIVSYYTKGALVALTLDLTLRQQSRGKHSLDSIMRALWAQHGAQHGAPGQGLTEDGLPKLIEQVTGLDRKHRRSAVTQIAQGRRCGMGGRISPPAKLKRQNSRRTRVSQADTSIRRWRSASSGLIGWGCTRRPRWLKSQ